MGLGYKWPRHKYPKDKHKRGFPELRTSILLALIMGIIVYYSILGGGGTLDPEPYTRGLRIRGNSRDNVKARNQVP